MRTRESQLEVNVGFVAVGRRVELVKAFRAAQRSLGLNGRLVGLDVDPLAPALQVCDTYHIVPRLDDPGFVSVLLEICNREKLDLIFPLIDPMIRVLAEARPELEGTGARVAVVSLESARMADDKFFLTSFFQGLGLTTPRSWLPDELDPNKAQYPLFIKPRRGSASQHAFKVRDSKELLFFREYVPDPIIQEYVDGPEVTSDVVCDLEGGMLGLVSRRRIEVRSGEVSKGVTIRDPKIEEGCVRIAEGLPAVGPITVQCLLRDGEPLFTEINARLGGGVPLAVAAGLDIPGLLLSRAAGIPKKAPKIGSYEVGIQMTRYDESFFLGKNGTQSRRRSEAIIGPAGN